jgi:ubiquinone/menaquinone biosynthesis C-methylase UbiE
VPAKKNSTDYYDATAADYDRIHGDEQNYEHIRALGLLVPIYFSNATSVLDVGTGTGRALLWLKNYFKENGIGIELTGIEPSGELARLAESNLPDANIVIGSGEHLPFSDNSFDLVTVTGVLHHVENPKSVLAELFRVSRIGVIISDHNNFSFGSTFARRLRLALFSAGLLELFSYVKQGFRRQGYSADDGWWYPYSVLNDFDIISQLSDQFIIVPTRKANSNMRNFMLSHSHLAVACIKKSHQESA